MNYELSISELEVLRRYQCNVSVLQDETFWKERHGRTYEKKMDDLLEVKRRVAQIYSLTGFDTCYALLLALKPLRGILPLPKYEEHAPALEALEQIKSECISQLGTYIHP